jgi:hypothetical protein
MEIFESTEGILLFSVFCLFVGCVILYYVIKTAIKDAHKEMDKAKRSTPVFEKPLPAPNWTTAQLALKSKYEKGELTFEEYTSEWNKIS